MKNKIPEEWHKVDHDFGGLNTGVEHEIIVQREALPLVFVPGIMGSVLRRSGTNGEGNDADGLPNMRWNPSSYWYMLTRFLGAGGVYRRKMLVGPEEFDGNFLEVHNTDPYGNGYQGVASYFYHGFLRYLENQDNWGSYNKVFDFPVFAVGYNWTDTNTNSGQALVDRIKKIKEEAARVTGKCDKVIVITHSMGGLVARKASQINSSDILGVIHGVQPAFGAPAAYWRVKAGFEGFGLTSFVMGSSGRTVTPVLGNLPGGLELLPSKLYFDNNSNKAWLDTGGDKQLPENDPFNEIYRIQGTGNEVKNPGRKYWD